jgi:hypothetical protein
MIMTTERPPVQQPDAGVIEEARSRQRRHRIVAAATIVAAAGVTAVVLAVGGGNQTGSGRSAHPGGLPAATPRATTVACGSQHAVTGAGSSAVTPLSILSVLRLPPARFPYPHGSPHHLARTLDGAKFYVYTPGPPQCSNTGIVIVSTQIGRGTGGVGDPIAATVQQQGLWGTAGSPDGSSFLFGLVPNGVASVTLRYPHKPATIARVINNVFVAVERVGAAKMHYRTGGRSPGARIFGLPNAMIWRSASDKVLKTIQMQ